MSNRTICEMHSEIQDLARQIIHFRSENFEEPDDAIQRMKDLADDIHTVSKEAELAGQSMESRMQEYHDTIEGLGFKRQR